MVEEKGKIKKANLQWYENKSIIYIINDFNVKVLKIFLNVIHLGRYYLPMIRAVYLL